MEASNYEAKIREKIQHFRLIDDVFMSKVFESKECTEYMLRIIMGNPNLKGLEVRPQCELKNLQGRSVRLDIKAVDEKGQLYDVEVQRADEGANAKRARHNSSLLDTNELKPGKDPELLPTTYVIFITGHDVLERNKALYHIDRVIRETGEYFGDEAHIIYVNGEYRGNDDIGKLMEDFFCTAADDMNSAMLASRVRYFKETKKGAENMCKIVEDLCQEAKNEGLQRGRQEGAIKNLCDLVHDKLLSATTAVSRSGLSEAEFTSWMNHFYPQS